MRQWRRTSASQARQRREENGEGACFSADFVILLLPRLPYPLYLCSALFAFAAISQEAMKNSIGSQLRFAALHDCETKWKQCGKPSNIKKLKGKIDR